MQILNFSTLYLLTAEPKQTKRFCNEEQESKTLCNKQHKNTLHCH